MALHTELARGQSYEEQLCIAIALNVFLVPRL